MEMGSITYNLPGNYPMGTHSLKYLLTVGNNINFSFVYLNFVPYNKKTIVRGHQGHRAV